MKLIHQSTGLAVKAGDRVQACNCSMIVAAGIGSAPCKEKQGFIWVKRKPEDMDLHAMAFKPDVYDCAWVE